ncbi:MAG: hypothetical protein QM731_01260 [Chitinophagaceae bacterium]
MKKNLKMVMAASMAILLATTAFTTNNTNAANATTKSKKLLDYVWYKDEEMTDPTGTLCSPGTEVSRLQTLFPANIFTTTYSGGLQAYEWGYNSGTATVIIYSDRGM